MEVQREEPPSANSSLLDGWLSRGEVAAELGVSIDTRGCWEVRRDGPPCIRIGRKVLYRAEAFREWRVSRERPARQLQARSGGHK